MQSLSFANPRRSQYAFFEGQNWATVNADIYLPQGLTGPAPLVIICPELGSNRRTFAYVAQHLASRGFAVAAIEQPGANTEAVERAFAGDYTIQGSVQFVARPMYVSMLLDELQRLSDFDPLWKGRLDMTRIGALGHSWGGYTVLALAGANIDYNFVRRICNIKNQLVVLVNPSVLLQCVLDSNPLPEIDLKDTRIKAVFGVNPLATAVSGPTGIAQIQIPTMILTASEDIFSRPVSEQINPFRWLTTKNKYLVLARNATHFTPTLSQKATDSAFNLPEWMLGPPPEQMFGALNALSTAFFKTYLEGAERYAAYLSEDYVRTLGQEPMKFSLVTALDEGIKQRLEAQFLKYVGEP
ncbi:alpha/beta hydrolase family protein [Gloeobacter morelensis]|uniref:Dienelactone hydrolase n=1 Tax=Gloeobacter morelensis MG652769 TaxID=2781736 RepID=A0ABY3PPP2_9CYAN|nr:hypothetical protein [Gloeobacter morelensis]UFP95672.1 hypothetical protein ISF26_05380 [Gloeobacter morelensis MG652769]